MKYIWDCRRTGLAFFGMLILGAALLTGKADTSMAIAGVVGMIAGSNAYEKKGKGLKPGLPKSKQRK